MMAQYTQKTSSIVGQAAWLEVTAVEQVVMGVDVFS
jgi:hypothetical protein